MYHIKNDKRSRKSAELIADAVTRLTDRKSYGDITITDIEKESSVARSTFYRLFDNTMDVLSYLCDCTFDELTELHKSHAGESIREITYRAGLYWMQHDKLLEIVAKSGYQYILVDSFSRHYPLILSYYMPDAKASDGKLNDYASSIIVSIIASSLITWARTGKEETIEEMCDMIVRVLDGVVGVLAE